MYDIEIAYSHISKMNITAARMQLNENHDEKDQKTTERTGENRTQYRLDWNLAGGQSPQGLGSLKCGHRTNFDTVQRFYLSSNEVEPVDVM
jgi:phosphatidylethanolamine-binding protein (PEBP) family uncharacterized protein